MESWNLLSSIKYSSTLPYAFTWEGCNMLATILRSDVATKRAIQIVRGFTQVEKTLSLLENQIATEQQAVILLKSRLEVITLLKVPEHLGMIESVKEVKKLTGIDYQSLLLQSSVMTNIPQEEEYLEPTELGKLFGKSAKEMNLILEELGMQVKISGNWNPTKLGNKYSVKHAWSIGTKSGYNYKWQVKEIRKRLDNSEITG